MFEPKTEEDIVQIARAYRRQYFERYGRDLPIVRVPVPTLAGNEIAEVHFYPGATAVRRNAQ